MPTTLAQSARGAAHVRAAAAPRRGAPALLGQRTRLNLACSATAMSPAAPAPSSPSTVTATSHTLPDGTKLELLVQKAAPSATGRPPVVFIHGSYHSAWCWKENFLPYFSARGYDAYSVSLRAQGASDPAPAGQSVAGTLETHAADLASLVAAVTASSSGGGGGGGGARAPVLVAHSFGGLLVQKYVLGIAPPGVAPASPPAPGTFPPLSGVAYLCSTPQSGNTQLVGRIFAKNPIFGMKLTWGFIARSFAKDEKMCREMFFSPDLPADKLARYQQALAAASPTRLIDLQNMKSQVPLPPPPSYAPPAFVLGCDNDTVVDVEAVKELAAYCGVQPVVLHDSAHECMLDTRWEAAAAALEGWLAKL